MIPLEQRTNAIVTYSV